MKKLLPKIAGFGFALFVLGVFGAMLLYSWQGLGNIFPNDVLGQSFGLLLFDLAALIWFAALVYLSRTVAQYVVAFVGFMVGLVGSLGLIGIEVGLSSGLFEAGTMQQPLTYIFIAVLVGHVCLIYAHHASTPEVNADISLGIEKAKITDKAQEAVEEHINKRIDQLAAPIADRLMLEVLQDLRISASVTDTINLNALPVTDQATQSEEEAKKNFLSWLPPFLGGGVKKWNTNAASVAVSLPVETPKPSPAPQSAESEEADGLKPKK